MAYDKVLADRIRRLLGARRGIREMEQFGGVGFLVKGNMALGVIGSDLLVRVGPDSYEDALKTPHTKAFAMTGRPMMGWVFDWPGWRAESWSLCCLPSCREVRGAEPEPRTNTGIGRRAASRVENPPNPGFSTLQPSRKTVRPPCACPAGAHTLWAHLTTRPRVLEG